MVRASVRIAAAFVLAASLCAFGAPARADMGEAIATQVVPAANTAIKNALTTHTTIGQVPPVSQKQVSKQAPGLPLGFTYTADFSIAYPYGDIGTYGKKWLPGGFDAVASYGFNPHLRLQASYYELQHYPVGFNNGVHPLYIQGLAPSIGCVSLSGSASGACSALPAPIDVTTKDKFLLLMAENLINVAGKLPVVITPTYVSRTSIVAASNGNGDVVAFEGNNGFPVYGQQTRTAQVKSIAFTLPFLSTPKMFGTFTVAPSWLMRTNGQNQSNHAQLYQVLYLEYNHSKTLKFFFEPQSSRDYLPTDQYPQHLIAYFLGVAKQVNKYSFVQLVLNSGGPTNQGAYGVNSLVCQQLPCGKPGNTIIQAGGLKATQLQLQFGIGSPSVIQF